MTIREIPLAVMERKLRAGEFVAALQSILLETLRSLSRGASVLDFKLPDDLWLRAKRDLPSTDEMPSYVRAWCREYLASHPEDDSESGDWMVAFKCLHDGRDPDREAAYQLVQRGERAEWLTASERALLAATRKLLGPLPLDQFAALAVAARVHKIAENFDLWLLFDGLPRLATWKDFGVIANVIADSRAQELIAEAERCKRQSY